MKKKIAVIALTLSTLAVAQKAAQVYHTHKLSAASVAIGCDQGTPTASKLDNLIVISCK